MSESPRFQVLWHEIELDLHDATAEVAAELRYLLNSAQHNFAARRVRRIAVCSSLAGHRITADGVELGTLDSAQAVLNVLYASVYDDAYAQAAGTGWLRVHAAVVDGPRTRALVVAPGGAGKTTLATALLVAGLCVPADESAVVRDGVAIPVTRRFHLRPDAETLVSGLAQFTTALPQVGEGRTRAFDPAEAGFEWTVSPRRVDHVILLRRSGGESRLTRHSQVAATPELVDQVFSCGESPGARFRAVAGLLRVARCWALTTGDLPDAVSLVKLVVEQEPAHPFDPAMSPGQC